jgi:hypothetical protein
MGTKTTHELVHNLESRAATPKRLIVKDSTPNRPSAILKSQDQDTLNTLLPSVNENDHELCVTQKKPQRKLPKHPVLAIDKACLSCSGNMN